MEETFQFTQILENSPVLSKIRERISDGVITVSRASAGASALVLAYASSKLKRPVLCLTASPDDAEQMRRDWTTFNEAPVEDFPLWESLFEEDSEPDPDTFLSRHNITDGFAEGKPLAVVAPLQAVLQPIRRTRNAEDDRRLLLRVGASFSMEQLAHALVDAGYRRFPQVARPGDFSIRGGIFDIFPRDAAHPYRLDYFGDEIDTIRAVSLSDQRSREEVQLLVLTLLRKNEYFVRGFTGKEVTLLETLPKNTILALSSPSELKERCRQLVGQWAKRETESILDSFWRQGSHLTHLELEPLPVERGRNPVELPVTGIESFKGPLDRVCEQLRREAAQRNPVEIYFRQFAEAERFGEILEEANVPTPEVRALVGELSDGFRWREQPQGGVFLSGSDILGRTRSLSRQKTKKQVATRAVDSFLELEEGDVVVHVAHGIGRYLGIRELTEGHRRGDHLVLEFREGVNLLVPAERIHMVQKYVGGPSNIKLDRVGGKTWSKKKARVEEAVVDLASEMLELQAIRSEREGYSFPTDNHWQEEFEAAFPFEETDDQLSSWDAVRQDMESSKPTDRLICGDVGYGKTEIAMRAAFKAVQAGKQVAVLVPTTVLAQQHLVTFRDRMAEFPIRIDALSRFRSRKEQSEILHRARHGELDILIGTHRLLSKDVSFSDLGLLIIDEEQRFGVRHKEALKQLRRLVDILTLTATPIPRTLHMTLIGVRDISSLMEAPGGRTPVHTEVTQFAEARFREIMLRELNRDGQIFFVHNRVKTIEARRQYLEALVPEARMVHVHGQMQEKELEQRMRGFLEKKYDVLVTTTIIESGLDIPSANTLIIDRSDRFGLAELHQLRGRVGRGQHKAYAYMLIPEDRPVVGEALDRLKAIEEFSSLGAGFQISLRDLEIRGAGNILGKEQSGHIATVGYDLYCRLLERAVANLSGTSFVEPPDVELPLEEYCRIPEDFVGDTRQRLRLYRAIATSLDEGTLNDIEEGIIDRYGDLPQPTKNLVRAQRLRISLGKWGARRANFEDGWLVLSGHSAALHRGMQGVGWETVSLPGGEVAGRPSSTTHLASLDDLVAALSARAATS